MRPYLVNSMLVLLGCQIQTGFAPAAELDVYRRYALEHEGNAKHGEQIFRSNKKLVCANCHNITDGKEKSGPNLDGIADKYPRKELIRHILEPSAFIQPGYESVTAITKDGRTYTGRLRLSTKLEIRVRDASGKQTSIKRRDIEEIHASTKSMMPDNLAASISKEEFADLIAWLETLHSSVLTGFKGPDEPVDVLPIETAVEFRPLFGPEIRFDDPVWMIEVPGQTGRFVVLEHQEGFAHVLDVTGDTPSRRRFLDLSNAIEYSPNQGLMCLAFHPKFAQNGRYFVKYEVQEAGRIKTTVAERRALVDRLVDSGDASRRLLELEQPAFNHNGGCLAFGPDGMLYIAFGDGGPQKDPPGFSQNPRIFHGSFLRIDVDGRDEGLPYRIPDDNPFLNARHGEEKVRPETWAYGFREPWRFSFDALSGDLWYGDVGQVKWEEVGIIKPGDNHGWNVIEGYESFSDEYRRGGETYAPPVFAYPRSFGVSVTGGYVYRGSRNHSFDGVYVFGDYESRRVWGLRQKDGRLTKIREIGRAPEHIASFAADSTGEIYLVGYEGTIFHVDMSKAAFN